MWESLFKMVVPRKYCIEQGVFIIDAFGHKSREVDLAIFDELYTPYIFNYGKIKFIPIEAVAAVVQCKGEFPDKKAIESWEESISALTTSMDLSLIHILVRVLGPEPFLGLIKARVRRQYRLFQQV